jgi:hypothetical protein
MLVLEPAIFKDALPMHNHRAGIDRNLETPCNKSTATDLPWHSTKLRHNRIISREGNVGQTEIYTSTDLNLQAFYIFTGVVIRHEVTLLTYLLRVHFALSKASSKSNPEGYSVYCNLSASKYVNAQTNSFLQQSTY